MPWSMAERSRLVASCGELVVDGHDLELHAGRVLAAFFGHELPALELVGARCPSGPTDLRSGDLDGLALLGVGAAGQATMAQAATNWMARRMGGISW
jgi:hypothetical protein